MVLHPPAEIIGQRRSIKMTKTMITMRTTVPIPIYMSCPSSGLSLRTRLMHGHYPAGFWQTFHSWEGPLGVHYRRHKGQVRRVANLLRREIQR
jgi:hypothetical protein